MISLLVVVFVGIEIIQASRHNCSTDHIERKPEVMCRRLARIYSVSRSGTGCSKVEIFSTFLKPLVDLD
jgi:hypothetical protein